MMDPTMAADALLLGASVGLGGLCLVLQRRLRRLSACQREIIDTVAALDAAAQALERALEPSRQAAASADRLERVLTGATEMNRQLERTMRSILSGLESREGAPSAKRSNATIADDPLADVLPRGFAPRAASSGCAA